LCEIERASVMGREAQATDSQQMYWQSLEWR
jgi:hypothetical protein